MMPRLYTLFLLICSCWIFTGCQKNELVDNQQSKTLTISMETDAQTLDPRRVRDLSTVTVIQMLYEGLMRTQGDDEVTPALAESVTISADKKTYTFHLRQSHWSNGELLTAHDIEKSWKSSLDPQFPNPNAYQLYLIKGAQLAKEGLTSLDDVAVHASDDSTLVVELEKPTPYFLALTTTHFFYPVHKSLLQQPGEKNTIANADIVTNGPFQLEKWNHQSELTAIANPHYWDSKHVHLKFIKLVVLDNPTALQLFHQGQLDWTGSPLSTLPVDALSHLKNQDQLEIAPAAGVYLMRVNTDNPPFNQIKMRQAFALALNRTDLVEHVLQGNQEPAFGIIPYSFLKKEPYFDDHNVKIASRLFQEAMDEQSLRVNTLPDITIHYATGERAHKIAQVAQQQWKETLGVNVKLQSNEAKVHFDQLKRHNYQLAIGSWFADFHDPISFLEIFKLKDNGTNNTNWENRDYIDLLDQSAMADNQEEREKLLKQAEHVIMNEMPVIPLFYSSYNYLKNPAIQGVYFSKLGYLDFKNAYLDHPR